ncbi:MAG: hypothetical protein WCH61_00750 [bacterium]
MAKAMPKRATQTKQSAKISEKELTITVKGKKTKVKVYVITVKGVEKYAVRRPLAPVDNAKYLPLREFEAAKNATKPRQSKKAAVAAVVFPEEAVALIPALAKLAKDVIKPLALAALKYKKANAKAIRAQQKVATVNKQIQKLQAKIVAMSGAAQ